MRFICKYVDPLFDENCNKYSPEKLPDTEYVRTGSLTKSLTTRMELFFDARPSEKALLRLALMGADRYELEEAQIAYEAILVLMPSPFIRK